MSVRWHELEEPWRLAFEQAVVAYLEQASIPIGAVVVDGRGQIIARGANAFAANRLAHAELNALVALPVETERAACEIYTTMEPCPMCTGAIRMSQLRAVHFAARDPSAGAAELLHINEFMRAFPCAVHPPRHEHLEMVIVALIMERRHRLGLTRWREHWQKYHPVGAAQGLALFESGAYSRWVAESATAQSIFDHVAAIGALSNSLPS